MTDRTPVVLVFLKYPAPGKVKTRLAAELGAEAAARIYRGMLDQVLHAVDASRPEMRVIGYFDGGPAAWFAEWSHLVDHWHAQPAGELGERLAAGFAWAHAGGGPVLAIGTDCPDIRPTCLGEAVEVLRTKDAVFGPATDGGYYLVGTRRHVPGFFDQVRWSSPHTLSDQESRCRDLGLSVARLATLDDIDTAADWAAHTARGHRP